MAKRNKAKFASKSRKSALRVEALEQRQLLAAVTGGGTEVGSNIVHPNGNVYDQVLMTGSTVTVTADAGQVTRVSFLDLSGDIVQAEFAGKGSLTISLDQFKAAAEAANYNQPGIKYVSGLATFTIQGEDSTTNFNVFSVGSGNAVNQTLFSGGKTGGNHVADVARLLIVADPTAPLGSTMGGIRAGNAVFADSAGVVGISAANVAVQGPVIVGDIDASNAGVPTLKFGANSQFATLTVAGGDFVQTNNQTFAGNVSGFQSINSTAGTDSTGAAIGSKVISGATVPGVNTVTLEVATAFDLTGKSQADIDAAFKGRTFTNDITINGDLSGVNNLSAAEFRGAVTFTGTLSGNVTIDGAVKSITLAKAQASSEVIKAASIGSLTTSGTADLAGTVTAKSIGAVTVGGNLSGTVSTDYDNNGVYSTGELAVGSVTVATNMSGTVYGVLGIGNVTVGGDLTTTSTALKTSSGTSGDAFLGSIGKLTVTGDVSQGSGALISILGNGTFGDITIGGAGTNTSSHNIGSIQVGGVLGATGTLAGKITASDNMGTGSTLNLGNINIGAGTGFAGTATADTAGTQGVSSISTNTSGNYATAPTVTISGGGGTGATATVSLDSQGHVSGYTITNAGTGYTANPTVTLSGGTFYGGATAGSTNGSLGGISVTNTTGNVSTGLVNFNGTGTVGDVSIAAGGGNSSTASLGGIINATGTAGAAIGNVSVTNAKTITINGLTGSSVGNITGTVVTAGTAVGAITLNGVNGNNGTTNATIGNITLNATTTDGSKVTLNGNISTNNSASNGSSSIGSISLTAGSDTASNISINQNIQASSIGAVTLTGKTTFADSKGIKALKGLASFTTTDSTVFNTTGGTANLNFGGATGPNLTFGGTTTFTGGAAPGILASNGGSALDAIGNITFNGKVVGANGKVDIRASSIGNISAVAALGQGDVLVTNLNVYAGNNGVSGATSGTSTEKVNRDGTNLSSYSIGNITVSNTNTIGVTNTALFGGQNSFNAIGAIGNVVFTGGGSAAVQTSLGTGAFLQTGNGSVVGAANAVVLTGAGIDFDGNASVGSVTTVTSGVFTASDESNSVFSTSATVSIGSITVNAAPNGTNDSIANLGGSTAGGTDGLVVLSGAKLTGTADYSTAGNLAGIDPTRLRGTVGDVLLQNLNQQLSRTPGAAANNDQTALTNPSNGGIVVGVTGTGTTAPVGKVQGLAFTVNATGPINADNYVVGGNDSTLSNDELQVIVL